ncbi:MAG: flagellar hook-basal body complex protein FliE [Chitinophagaceae bacterium]|nr:flagellar hook-basal body complex protein FliE [Oligoflexus sp.]
MSTIGSGLKFDNAMMGQLHDLKDRTKMDLPGAGAGAKASDKPSFMDHLKQAMEEVNTDQVTADKKATDLASGKDTNIHETMLSASTAELSFNMMVQVRNKALAAYQEIMRMPV